MSIRAGAISTGLFSEAIMIERPTLTVRRGCVTPQQISNLNKFMEGEWELLENLDEMPEEWQTKIKRACEQGHVDDEDWKWDPEVNRPGAKRVIHKKKPTADIGDNEDAANKTIEKATKPKANTKKRSRKPVDDDDETEPSSPPKKKKAAAKSKAKPKTEEDENDDAAPVANEKKVRKPKAKKEPVKKEEEDDEEAAPAPAKKSRAKKAKSEPQVKDEDNEEEEEVKPKPKKHAPTKSKAAKATAAVDAGEETAEKPVAKRGRKKKADN
jgi:hypothetical protein